MIAARRREVIRCENPIGIPLRNSIRPLSAEFAGGKTGSTLGRMRIPGKES
ncbi:MAG: hypothetical protein LBK57_00560 [Clostridiales Family XIII bacterium]|jgi:hypothetical protein|nr:hypothetical protein [Clostridiales Family XIII bacterium]